LVKDESMETVGLVGVGKIGLPIAENLIKSGYRVLGYRRSSLAEFEKIGGVTTGSPADIGAQADIVFSCLPSSQALEDVVQGSTGLIKSARPGQIIVELGSHPVPEKERHVARLQPRASVEWEAGKYGGAHDPRQEDRPRSLRNARCRQANRILHRGNRPHAHR
jgi:3-hydroxyisobutyrate dehydrogenase